MQTEYFGNDAVENLKEILDKHNPSKVFIVSAKSSYELCGAKSAIERIVPNVTSFNDFSPNPKIEDIKKGVELFKKDDYELVIAIGGGSVIDVAKSINIFSAQEGEAVNYVLKHKKIINKGKPLIAVPTTAGSGSEATHFAVIYINGIKYSLAHEYILPDYSIVDPRFTRSLPSKITASTGIDALAQAIESYWCINSTEESKGYATEAIKLVMANIVNAVNNPTEESREAMAKAAHLAGKAINISKTTAAHAISYPITSYFGFPHGHAVGLTLPYFFVYNSKVTEEDVLDKRGVGYVRRITKEISELIGAVDEESAKNQLLDLMRKIGLQTNLKGLGISDIEIIIKEGFNPERVKNNPRRLTEERLREILNELS